MTKDFQLEYKNANSKYRFLRRYIMKFLPDLCPKTIFLIEGKGFKEVKKLENEIINWKFEKESFYKRIWKKV